MIGELSSTLVVYAYDGDNGLLREPRAIPLLPEGWTGENTASEVACSPDGHFIYAGNRGFDAITVLRVHDDSGTVTLAGQFPRAARSRAISPSTPPGNGSWPRTRRATT